MPYIAPETVAEVKKMDLLTYLKNSDFAGILEPMELLAASLNLTAVSLEYKTFSPFICGLV